MLTNEFAAVEAELDISGNGPRLKITDRRGGGHVYLDPLELASLTMCSRADFEWLVDPARVAGGTSGGEETQDEADASGKKAHPEQKPQEPKRGECTS